MVTSRLLEEGRARVEEALQKGYAPSHFPHNLELIFVDDSRRSASLSMRTKIASTRERSAILRTLEPDTLIWWAVAFPMRQWSGGRRMSRFAFDSLVRFVRGYTAETHGLLPIVQDDLHAMRLKYPFCEILQDFLNTLDLVTLSSSFMTTIDMEVETPPHLDLSHQRDYVHFTGALYGSMGKLPDLLREGIEGSRKYQDEKHSQANISTAVDIFVPTDPTKHDAYAIVPIGSNQVWHVLHGLGMVALEHSDN